MHKLVELEGINFASIPPIELHAKLAEGFAQLTIVSDPRPLSDKTCDLFWNFLHRLVWLTLGFSRGGTRTHPPPSAASRVRRIAQRSTSALTPKNLWSFMFAQSIRALVSATLAAAKPLSAYS